MDQKPLVADSDSQSKRKFSLSSSSEMNPRTRHAGSDPVESLIFAPANSKMTNLVILERPSKTFEPTVERATTPHGRPLDRSVVIKKEDLDFVGKGQIAGNLASSAPDGLLGHNVNSEDIVIKKEDRGSNDASHTANSSTDTDIIMSEDPLFTIRKDPIGLKRVAGESRPAPEDRSLKPPRNLVAKGAEPDIISWLDISRCRVPTDKEIQKVFKARRELEDNLVRHSLFLDWIVQVAPSISSLCEERFAVHWGTIRARYDCGIYLNSMSPNRYMPKERCLVELKVRRDPNARISIAIVSPIDPAHPDGIRKVYGWMIQNSPINRIGFAHILELAATGHSIHGYIVPGESFEVKTVPAFRLDDDDESYENLEAEGEQKPRLRFKMTIDSICFVVHYGADCPVSLDFGSNQTYKQE